MKSLELFAYIDLKPPELYFDLPRGSIVNLIIGINTGILEMLTWKFTYP